MPRVPVPSGVVEDLADTMFALSTPTRVQILLCLLDGPRTVSELTEELDMEQSAVSHQLRVLREHTLVNATKVWRQRVYSLHDEHVVALLEAAVQHIEDRAAVRRAARDTNARRAAE